MPPIVQTIFFDAAGTLFRVRQPVGKTYAGFATRFGLEAASAPGFAQRLDRAFAAAFRAVEPMAFPGAAIHQLRRLERNWWLDVVRRTFESVDAPFPRIEEFFDEVYRYFASDQGWLLEPSCRPTLQLLRARGLKLGVISNFDSRLPDVLSSLGILGFFDSVTTSSACGSAKPARGIFQAALRATGADAGLSIHVGDDLEDDWKGASEAGLRAILYDPTGRNRLHPGERVEALAGLSEFLV